MTTVSIRQANALDLEPLEKLNDEIHEYHRRANPEVFKKLAPGALREHVLSYINVLNSITFVAEASGHILGFVQVKIEEIPENAFQAKQRHGLVNSLGVTASARRSRVASQLMEAAETWMRERGHAKVLLNVWEFNEPAISFYEGRKYATYSRKMALDLGSETA